MKSHLRNFLCFSLLLAGSLSAHALTIVRSNDPSLTANLSPTDVAAASGAFDYAAAQYSALYNDPIQVNITLAAVPGTGTLGGSSTALVGFFSYTTIRNALIADAVSPDDATAIAANLPVSDPTGGHNWVTSRAQGKALGLVASDATTDGTFTFGAGFSYTYDPNNRAVAGKIDFIGVAFHEISEIMGRIPGLGANFGDGGPDYLPFDLFRYTGSATRSFTGGSGNYFSIDNGATDLKNFNFPNGNGSDPQDWASGANDAYNAFSSSSVLNALTAVDIQAMDVIGYNLGAAPLTTTIFLGDFESGNQGFTYTADPDATSNLWHTTTRRSASSSHSQYYGLEVAGDYDTGACNAGNLVSPPISLVGAAGPVTLSFKYFLQTEQFSGFDVATVLISTNAGSTWITLGTLPDSASFTTWSSDISVHIGKTVLVEFNFDTVDNFNNSFEGWYIDDVTITGGGSAPPFQITSIVRSNNNILIKWSTGIGQTNALQATAGPANGSYTTNGFANIFIVTNIVTTSTNYTDVGAATNIPSRFYRVRLVP